ncbi:hypothetical protein [Streptomyces coeruleorubidus]|uniref:Tn3 transposase DDE domain-containing protein n=1 Tax=Streptomyces coeruleorubidus TaxID=116188 RepID=A0ABZ0KUF2_STRC4|nr:hypothetical protein [Streptomyces coeruleorubidus]WOT40612.1 hypothetical protein R5U08_41695 [Streptomyces coeruleorubidus]
MTNPAVALRASYSIWQHLQEPGQDDKGTNLQDKLAWNEPRAGQPGTPARNELPTGVERVLFIRTAHTRPASQNRRCPQEDLLITPQLHTEDFTQADVEEFHRLMTILLTTCRSIADEHSPDGSWTPTNPELFGQFGESMQLIATVSRALNNTRRGIRRIDSRARQRLYDRSAA